MVEKVSKLAAETGIRARELGKVDIQGRDLFLSREATKTMGATLLSCRSPAVWGILKEVVDEGLVLGGRRDGK